MKPAQLLFRRCTTLLVVVVAASPPLAAQSEHTLHRFTSGSDGDNRLAGLVTDSAGNPLFGLMP